MAGQSSKQGVRERFMGPTIGFTHIAAACDPPIGLWLLSVFVLPHERECLENARNRPTSGPGVAMVI